MQHIYYRKIIWHHRFFPTMSPYLKMSTRTLKILYYSQEATFKKHFGKKRTFLQTGYGNHYRADMRRDPNQATRVCQPSKKVMEISFSSNVDLT